MFANDAGVHENDGSFEALVPQILGLILPSNVEVYVGDNSVVPQGIYVTYGEISFVANEQTGEREARFDAFIGQGLDFLPFQVRIYTKTNELGNRSPFVAAEFQDGIVIPRGRFFEFVSASDPRTLSNGFNTSWIMYGSATTQCLCEQAGGSCTTANCDDQNTCGTQFASCGWVVKRGGSQPNIYVFSIAFAIIAFYCYILRQNGWQILHQSSGGV